MQEIWKDIKGWEGIYEISSLGRIKSHDREIFNSKNYYKIKGKILKPFKGSKGYLRIDLCDRLHSRYKKSILVHRLVAEAFIENTRNLPQVNHKDLNKENNCAFNLEWVTCKENIAHAIDNGCHENRYSKTVYGYSKSTGESIITTLKDSKSLGFNSSHITSCIKGRRKTHKGFIWALTPNELAKLKAHGG